ncbi:PQQ-binding-like beta-propeller repeat protein [Streptomyces sp. NPDC058001]|uniref:protein kinase domain-containing protein n=1 Tax=Streptomyces sp. NPDC058001 TaxID=3346300 RepID=UPI0036EAD12B
MSGTASPAGEPLLPGDPERLGGHRLLGRLGAGGMGQVYLGRSPGGRLVAVKTVHEHLAADPHFRERFRREAAAARAVTGAFTAAVVDADPRAAVPWLATAYLPGVTLRRAVSLTGPLPPAAVRALGGALAEALRSIHTAGLVHRDLKPSNVLVTGDGPRVIDFGIARGAGDRPGLTGTGDMIGTPGYMAPEQIVEGLPVSPATDVFALGAVLAYTASGRAPFGPGNAAVLLYRAVNDAPDLTDVPEEYGLRELIADCLHKSPERRPDPEAVLRRTADRAAPLWWRTEPLRSLVTGAGHIQPPAEPKSEPAPEPEPEAVRRRRFAIDPARSDRRATLARRALLLTALGGLTGLIVYSTRLPDAGKGGDDVPDWTVRQGSTAPGAKRWTLTATSGAIDGMLVTESGVVLHGTEGIGSVDGTVQARAAERGDRLWRTEASTAAPTAWGVSEGFLTAGDVGVPARDATTGREPKTTDQLPSTLQWFTVVGTTLICQYEGSTDSAKNVTHAVALRSGERAWQDTDAIEWQAPAVLGDHLFLTYELGGRRPRPRCVGAYDGRTRWEYDGTEAAPLLVGGIARNRFALLTDDGLLHVIDTDDGSAVRRPRKLGVPVSPGSTALDRLGTVGLLLSGKDLYGLDPDTGAVVWNRPALGLDACWTPRPGGRRTCVGAGGLLLHWSSDRTLEAIEPSTGRRRWTVPDLGDGPAQCPPVVEGDTVYAAAGSEVVALRLTDRKERGRWPLNAPITALTADTRGPYTLTGRATVHAHNKR